MNESMLQTLTAPPTGPGQPLPVKLTIPDVAIEIVTLNDRAISPNCRSLRRNGTGIGANDRKIPRTISQVRTAVCTMSMGRSEGQLWVSCRHKAIAAGGPLDAS
jgi:hypothetical protein